MSGRRGLSRAWGILLSAAAVALVDGWGAGLRLFYRAGEARPAAGLYAPFWSDFRPVYGVAYGIACWLDPRTPMPFLVLHIVMHVGATLAVAALAARLARRASAALFAGLLFGLHPAHAPALLSISAGPEILATLLVVAATSSFLVDHEAPAGGSAAYFGPGGVWSSLQVTIGPFVGPLLLLLACLADPRAALLVLVLVLVPPAARPAAAAPARLGRVRWYLGALLVAVVATVASGRRPASPWNGAEGPARHLAAVGASIHSLLLPVGAPITDRLPRELVVTVFECIGVAGVLLVGMLLVARRTRRDIVVGAALLLLFLLPALLLARVQTYTATAGLALLAAALWNDCERRLTGGWRVTLWASAALILATFAWETTGRL